jgi:hypothetical protein
MKPRQFTTLKRPGALLVISPLVDRDPPKLWLTVAGSRSLG